MECRLLGEVIGFVVRGDKSSDDVAFSEPTGGDLNPILFDDLDVWQASELLGSRSARRPCESKNLVARKGLVVFEKFRQRCDNASSGIASGAGDKKCRRHVNEGSFKESRHLGMANQKEV